MASEDAGPFLSGSIGRRVDFLGNEWRRNTADLAGTCSGGKSVVSRAGEAYDALLGSGHVSNSRRRLVKLRDRLKDAGLDSV